MSETDDLKPTPTGKVLAFDAISLKGMFIPWDKEIPVLIASTGTEILYMPVFDTKEELNSFLSKADIPYSTIKVVHDGIEVLVSLPEGVKVAVRPRFTEDGKVRWMELTPLATVH